MFASGRLWKIGFLSFQLSSFYWDLPLIFITLFTYFLIFCLTIRRRHWWQWGLPGLAVANQTMADGWCTVSAKAWPVGSLICVQCRPGPGRLAHGSVFNMVSLLQCVFVGGPLGRGKKGSFRYLFPKRSLREKSPAQNLIFCAGWRGTWGGLIEANRSQIEAK